MRFHGAVAIALARFQAVEILHFQFAAAPHQQFFRLPLPDHAVHIGSPYAEHRRELLLRQRNDVIAGALHRRDEPFGGALFDRVARITGGGLKHLRQ